MDVTGSPTDNPTDSPGAIRGTEVKMAGIRERFGGIDTPAALLGMFAAFGVLVFLGALVTAGAAGITYQLNAVDVEGNIVQLSLVGMATALVLVFSAFLAGGWAAGRMARYDGGINGIGTAIWALLMIALFGAIGWFFGTEYNAFQRAGLPNWFSQLRGDGVTALTVSAAVLSVAAMFGGGYVGGKFGEMFHQRADAAIADASDRANTAHRRRETA